MKFTIKTDATTTGHYETEEEFAGWIPAMKWAVDNLVPTPPNKRWNGQWEIMRGHQSARFRLRDSAAQPHPELDVKIYCDEKFTLR